MKLVCPAQGRFTLIRVSKETRERMAALIGRTYYSRGIRTLGALVDALVDAETRRTDAERPQG